MVVYFGTFTAYGYEICRRFKTKQGGVMTEAVYFAGNCQTDSTQFFPKNAPGTLDIATIEQYCEDTGKRMAEESGGVWRGCSHDPDAEADVDAQYAEL
jgi:hypothetical protein